MDRKFIVDKEINLKDFDYLKTDIYADNLVDVIDNTENNTEPDKVFTIGLFGSWGSGKSSIVTTAQDTLEKRTDQKIKFITYDAWQYANDSFRRMFLLKVKEELKLEDQDLLKRFYSNESHDVENKYKLSSTKTLWILGAIIMVIIGIQFFPKLEFDWKVPVTSFLTVLSVLIAVISGAFYQLKITETKPYLFAPEQFEDCFKQMIAISLKKFNWIHKALYVITGDKTVKDLDKLVIVIDNIDRCSNGTAYNLLTDIKTFLGSESYNIVFVIPVDDEALRKHILGIKNSNDGDDCNKDKEEFLRKFFNVTIRIKPYFETDMFAFAKAINDKYNLHFNNNTVNIVSKEYATNPRRIIQLFNNLNTELNLYKQDDGFAEKNETLICCLLILREEFNDFYKKVLNNPTLFIKGSIDNKDKDKDKDKDKEKDKEKEKEKRFINITRNYVTEKDYVTVSKILSNSNNLFPNIPEDIKDSINTNDTEKIIKFISENNSEAGSVFEYIIMQMDRAISNGLIETDFKDLFELILLINKAKEITKDTNIRINEKSLSHLGSIIESTTYHDELCLYATTQEKQKNQSLKNDIINYLINRDSSTPYWINLFNIVLRQFQDKEIAKKLKTIFIENNDKIDFSNLKLSADQFTYMVDDEYVNQKISDLIDLDLESKESGKILWLLEKKENISTETYSKLFLQVKNLFGTFNEKTQKEIEDFINYLNPLVEKIQNNKLEKIQSYVDISLGIFNDRTTKTRNDYGQTIANAFNFIDESIQTNQDSSIDELIKFIYNTYRITNEKGIVKDAIVKLSKSYRKRINPVFINLIDAGFSITSLKDIFIEDENYENENSLLLIEYAFNYTGDANGGESKLPIETTKEKINSMLNYAHENKSEAVYNLINKLAEDEYYKKQIIDIIKSKSSRYINELPQKLLELALESFNEKNYREYTDNNEFLSVIAKNGNKKKNKLLLKILEERIDSNNNIDDTLAIIDSIPFDKYDGSEKRILITRLEQYLEDQKETIEEQTNERIKKIIQSINS